MSIISWTSPAPSARILPVSSETSSPRGSLCARSSSPNRRMTSPRFGAGRMRHSSNLRRAAATRASYCTRVTAWMRPWIRPVDGSTDSSGSPPPSSAAATPSRSRTAFTRSDGIVPPSYRKAIEDRSGFASPRRRVLEEPEIDEAAHRLITGCVRVGVVGAVEPVPERLGQSGVGADHDGALQQRTPLDHPVEVGLGVHPVVHLQLDGLHRGHPAGQRTIIRTVFPAVSGAKFAPVNAGPIRCPMEMVQAENHLARPPW